MRRPRPQKLPAIGTHKSGMYRVQFGKTWTGVAKPLEMYFSDFDEAEGWRDKTAGKLRRGGFQTIELSEIEQSDAQEALAVLKELSHLGAVPTLKQVAQDYVKRHAPSGRIKVKDGIYRFVESRKTYIAPSYRDTMKRDLLLVEEDWGDRFFHDIQPDDVKLFLETPRWSKGFAKRMEGSKTGKLPFWNRRTEENLEATLAALWKYGLLETNNWCSKDPVELYRQGRPKTNELKPKPGIIRVPVLEILLKGAIAHDPDYVPFLGIASQTGIRRSENLLLSCEHISWSDDPEARGITVPAWAAKDSIERLVPLPEGLYQLLLPLRGRTGPITPGCISDPKIGKEAYKHNGTIENRRRQNLKRKLGLTMPRNALRHGASSHGVAATKNPGKVAWDMNHSMAVMRRNYSHPVSEKEGKEWFKTVERLAGEKNSPPKTDPTQ